MPQSSLTAWLKTPAAVKQAPPSALPPAGNATPAEQLLTPPSPSQAAEDNAVDTASPAHGCSTAVALRSTSEKPSLPPNVHIRTCTKEDIPALKRLNSLLLPIPYPESFYREILEDPLTSNITLLATWHDEPSTIGKEKGRLVGAIRCRLLASPSGLQSMPGQTSGAEKRMLYLSTLVLLSPYRSHGIATHLLHRLTVKAVEDYGVGSVGAHVWELNVEGLEWYGKRGFKEVAREKDYYRRLKPSGAVVLKRDVRVMDLVGG